MRKKILSLALALAMCLGLMAVTAYAAEPEYTVEDGVLTKTWIPGSSAVVPKGVTTIGYAAFWGKKALLEVTLPEGLKEIGLSAFYRCENMTSVNIPSSVTTIGDSAFEICYELTGVTLPNGLTTIGTRAFSGCKSLTSMTIPDSVTSMGMGAFSGCQGLTSLKIGRGVTSISTGLFSSCINLTSVTVPDGVTSIEDNAFNDCYSLTDVVLPDSLKTIGEKAFARCAMLKHITIPKNVTTIGAEAFGRCPSLASVTIPSSVTDISRYAFYNSTALTDVYYAGTKAQLDAIANKSGLVNAGELFGSPAKIHYNSAGPGTGTTTPVQPQQPAGTTASPTNDKLEVNGSAANPTVYKIGGSNYFKIRDVAALLNGTEKQFAVGYDGAKNAVTATTGQGYAKQSGDLAGAAKGGSQSAAASNDAIYVNGEKITAEVYKINGSNYFKLRDLGKALNFYVGWSADRGMYIETGKPYSE